jgi:hypothetical protein
MKYKKWVKPSTDPNLTPNSSSKKRRRIFSRNKICFYSKKYGNWNQL